MQQNLKDISLDEIVEMLKKNMTYFLSLRRGTAMSKHRIDAKAHIDLILTELRTREGYEEISNFDVNIKQH